MVSRVGVVVAVWCGALAPASLGQDAEHDSQVATAPQHDTWISQLGDPDWEVRIRAAWSLAVFHPTPTAAIEPLLDALFDDPPYIARRRREAKQRPNGWYCAQGDSEAGTELEQIARLKHAARDALVGIGAPAAQTLFDELLGRKQRHDPGGYRGHQVRGALLRIGAPAFAMLIRETSSSEARRRGVALSYLREMKANTSILAPRVAQALTDGDAEVRETAVGVVARRPDLGLDHSPAIELYLGAGSVHTRAAAMEIVARRGALGSQGISPLVAGLEADRKVVRWAAVEALGALASTVPEARAAVIGAVASRRWRVAARALRAVGVLARTDPGLSRTLVSALRDTRDQVQRAAMEALVASGRADATAIVPLLSIGRRGPQWLDSYVSGALAAIGEPARPALVALLDDDVLGDIVRRALRGIGGPALKLLADAQDDEKRRGAATRVVVETDEPDEAGIEALVKALRGSERYQRTRAAWLLGRLGERGAPAIPALIAVIRRGEDAPTQQEFEAALNRGGSHGGGVSMLRLASVRQVATEALASIGPPAVPGGLQLLADQDVRARVAGARVLGGIGAAAASAVPTLRRIALAPEGGGRHAAALAAAQILHGDTVLARYVRIGSEARARAIRTEHLSLHLLRELTAETVPHTALAHALRAQLGDKQAGARARAAAMLGAMAPLEIATLTAIAELLHDRDWAVRRVALTAIAASGARSRGLLPAILATRDALDPNARSAYEQWGWQLARALEQIGPPAVAQHHVVPLLLRISRTGNWQAMARLQKMAAGSEGAVDALVVVVGESAIHEHMRLSAASSVIAAGRTGEIVDVLARMVRDYSNPDQVTDVLVQAGAAARPAIPAILDRLSIETHDGMRRSLIAAVNKIRGH